MAKAQRLNDQNMLRATAHLLSTVFADDPAGLVKLVALEIRNEVVQFLDRVYKDHLSPYCNVGVTSQEMYNLWCNIRLQNYSLVSKYFLAVQANARLYPSDAADSIIAKGEAIADNIKDVDAFIAELYRPVSDNS